MRAFALGLLALAAAKKKGAIEATDKNFDDIVFNSGKGSFVKFLAPWWGHCKKMKPDWDKLGTTFAESDAVSIVDVDCTAPGGDAVCGKQGVRGYPTIKYKLADDKGLKDYNGAREYAGMKDFVEKTFKKPCDWKTLSGCAPNEKEFIGKWSDKSAAEVKEELDKRNADLKQVKKDKSAAEAEIKQKIKDLTKKEKNMQKSLNILKDMEKSKKKDEL